MVEMTRSITTHFLRKPCTSEDLRWISYGNYVMPNIISYYIVYRSFFSVLKNMLDFSEASENFGRTIKTLTINSHHWLNQTQFDNIPMKSYLSVDFNIILTRWSSMIFGMEIHLYISTLVFSRKQVGPFVHFKMSDSQCHVLPASFSCKIPACFAAWHCKLVLLLGLSNCYFFLNIRRI